MQPSINDLFSPDDNGDEKPKKKPNQEKKNGDKKYFQKISLNYSHPHPMIPNGKNNGKKNKGNNSKANQKNTSKDEAENFEDVYSRIFKAGGPTLIKTSIGIILKLNLL